jgi:hypothetical protein
VLKLLKVYPGYFLWYLQVFPFHTRIFLSPIH